MEPGTNAHTLSRMAVRSSAYARVDSQACVAVKLLAERAALSQRSVGRAVRVHVEHRPVHDAGVSLADIVAGVVHVGTVGGGCAHRGGDRRAGGVSDAMPQQGGKGRVRRDATKGGQGACPQLIVATGGKGRVRHDAAALVRNSVKVASLAMYTAAGNTERVSSYRKDRTETAATLQPIQRKHAVHMNCCLPCFSCSQTALAHTPLPPSPPLSSQRSKAFRTGRRRRA